MTLRFTFRSCKTTCEELASTISNTYNQAISNGVIVDSIEIISAIDKSMNKVLLNSLKEINSEVSRIVEFV